ncbi:unnamed protein product [Owenia fusiformis]|uniref:Uncharacterized protein n=1 Tax=Owenia fusiformis TaxID=6347 RepID=A0A8S4P756_OWEFU|nr:unnamed protein product [Owenia fusiformis]
MQVPKMTWLIVFIIAIGQCIGQESCPPEDIVQCERNPCDLSQGCPACPGATCRPNYCRGCNAIFYQSDGSRVTDCGIPDCAPEDVVHCFVDPCEIAREKGCSGYPEAICVSSFCKGCNATWYDKCQKVECGA